MPGRGVLAMVAVTSSIVSPLRTKTAPLACSATRPVSKLMERSPTRCSIILGSGVMGLLARPPHGLVPEVRNWGQRCSLLRRYRQSLTPRPPGGGGPYLVVGTLANRLAAEAELLNEGPVAGDIASCEIVQQAPATADQPQKAKARVMVLGMLLEVVGEIPDPLGHESHLDLRRPGVGVVGPVLLDDV